MVLFLDFDGTLVPIVQRPELALLDPITRQLLHSLSRWMPVVVISGRALRDLKARVSVPQLIYVGNHGLEMEGPSLKYRMKDNGKWIIFIKKLYRELKADLGKIPGILVENKRYTLSVHYRLVRGEARKRALRLFSARLRPYRGKGLIRTTEGKAVWEVRPPYQWHKGKAVDWILKRPNLSGRWPLYIGDDRTDQDALKMVRSKGVGIYVASPHEKGAAHYTLQSPRVVRQFLRWLLSQVSGQEGTIRKVLF